MNDVPHTPLSPASVPVCAIGASAGGVGALQTLFRLLPADLGLAYVVIVHLAPDHPSAMHEILGATTRMPVFQVVDGPTLKANCVYVIAPDSELVIDGNEVRSRPFTEARSRRAPIDMFFRSVAAGRGDGIAVVLTGAGSDGAVGVRAIKEAGGLIMVQEPAEAGHPSMPQNVIATGVADVIAPLARLAERIAEAARSKDAVRSLDGDGAANEVRRIIAFLRLRTGHDFSGYKRSTVLRRISRRMQVCQIASLGEYARYLRDTPEETEKLFADLLISVTTFFRDPEAFATLGHSVIQPLLENLDTGETESELRAWVVGCATGEEAYSLAILLLEEAERLKLHVPIQIFATDLDEGALATAREGRYPRTIEADVSAERLKRFFADEGTHYRINRRVRDLVLFATHSVVREPPFMRLDLVTCRNVLIYLERALQQHVCSIFHYGLKPNGYLFLGTAEAADASQNQFVAVEREARIYRAVPADLRMLPLLSTTSVAGPSQMPADYGRSVGTRFEAGEVLGASHAAALEANAPPSALVDADHVVLHLSPTAGRFILLSAGPLSGKLPTIVRPELRLDLKLALDRVFETGQPTVSRIVDAPIEGAPRRVSAHVAPVPAAEGLAPRAMVFFLDNGPGRATEESPSPPDELRHLHGELKAAQEAELAGRLRHETAVQELRASNEELQSLNEEYRSTAEELETSKEELQSINEELQTVNAELKTKLSIISAAHNDLLNLTASSEIGTLFLDTELRIRMFTPPVADLINVTTTDTGRPITDFTHRLAYDGIEPDVRRVLADFIPIETEVRSRDGRWFTMRVRPYRTLENQVEGAVVTFDDVTARRLAEMSLRDSEERFRAFVTASTDVVYRMSPDWSEMRQLEGRAFLRDTGAPTTAWLDDYIHPDDQAAVRAAIDHAIETRSTFEYEHRVIRADGSLGWTLSRAVPILADDGHIKEWLGAASDVTDRVEALEAWRESEALRTVALAGGRMGTWRWDLASRLIRGDAEFMSIWGYPPSDMPLPLERFTDRMSAEGAAEMQVIATRFIEDGEEFDRILEVVSGPTTRRWIRWRGRAAADNRSVLYGVSFDITEQREAEARLHDSEERLRTLVEGVPQLVWRADAQGLWTWSSPQWTAYTGLSAAESRGSDWLAAVHPDDRAGAAAAWTNAFADDALTMENRIYNKREGTYRWFATRATAVRNALGEVNEWLGTSTDVHDLRELQERQQVLVAELQHRTRNLIGVVRATMEATLRTSPGFDDFIDKFRARIGALSRVQALLSRLNTGERITFDQLIHDELAAIGALERAELTGPSGVALRSSTVQTFALALHELATNAIKYGALAQADGRLAITWRLEATGPDQKPWLHVEWHETGVAMPTDGAARQGGGQGRQLIERALPYQLGAKTTYVMGPDGVRCSITLPVSTRTTAQNQEGNDPVAS